jgi:hypothetical protein
MFVGYANRRAALWNHTKRCETGTVNTISYNNSRHEVGQIPASRSHANEICTMYRSKSCYPRISAYNIRITSIVILWIKAVRTKDFLPPLGLKLSASRHTIILLIPPCFSIVYS